MNTQRSRKTWNIEYNIPLQAVFFLEHAESDTSEPLGEARAAVYVQGSAQEVCQKYWRIKDGEPRRAFTSSIFAESNFVFKLDLISKFNFIRKSSFS